MHLYLPFCRFFLKILRLILFYLNSPGGAIESDSPSSLTETACNTLDMALTVCISSGSLEDTRQVVKVGEAVQREGIK